MTKRKTKSKTPDVYFRNLKDSDYINISRKDKSKGKKFGTFPEDFADIMSHLGGPS